MLRSPSALSCGAAPTLDLHDIVLGGMSMGGGEVARYFGTYGSERVSAAVVISGVPPFLLKTAETPNGLDQSVFDDIQAMMPRTGSPT